MPLITRVFADHEALSRAVARRLMRQLAKKPAALFCLATGQTPIRAYEHFARFALAAPGSSAALRVLKLDEWGGIPLTDPAACETYLRHALIDRLQIEERYLGFDSSAPDPAAECRRVAAWLAIHGPIDVCVLGLGMNGHLGFNEPAPYLQAHAHVAKLSETSLRHSMLAAASAVPVCGLTLGMADLLQARKIFLLVSGTAKREPLRRLLAGTISTEYPASFLALHPRCEVCCDQAAGEGLLAE
jgi:galactosamine-6-phosphate isomerase